MRIDKVISYKNSWNIVKNKFSTELSEIELGLTDFFPTILPH